MMPFSDNDTGWRRNWRVTAEYESLKARLEALRGSVAQATVRLDFGRPVRSGPLGWVFFGLSRG
jgi:hypothetical protein